MESEIETYRMGIPQFMNRLPLLSAKMWVLAGNSLFSRYVEANGRPDVIYAHTMFYAGLFAEQIHRRHGIPYVIIEHDSGYARGFIKRWQVRLGKNAATSSRSNIAVGKRFSKLLDSVYGLAPGSWAHLPNMVSEEFFEIPLPALPSGGQFVYCTVCNLNPNKGIDLLIRAFKNVFHQRSDSRLLIVGEGDEKSKLQDLAFELGVDSVVDFHGKATRQEVISLIAESHVVVSASYYETFGIVLAEANALGRPVIATRSGGPEDFVTSDNGILSPVGDVDKMAAVMMRIRDTYGEYDPVAIRRTCESRFSESVFVHSIEKVMQSELCEV